MSGQRYLSQWTVPHRVSSEHQRRKREEGRTAVKVLLVHVGVAGDVLWLLLVAALLAAEHLLEEAELRVCCANEGDEDDRKRKEPHFGGCRKVTVRTGVLKTLLVK